MPKSTVEPESTVESKSQVKSSLPAKPDWLFEAKSVVQTESVTEPKSPSKLSESPVEPRSVTEPQLMVEPQPSSETKSPDELQPQAKIQSAKILVANEQPVNVVHRSGEEVANVETATPKGVDASSPAEATFQEVLEGLTRIESQLLEQRQVNAGLQAGLMKEVMDLHITDSLRFKKKI